MSEMRYQVTVEEDENGELILPLPDGLLKEMNWKEGDTLKFNDNKDGTFSMSKVVTGTKLVLVETISTFRMRYVVELSEDSPVDWAFDTVCCEEASEFSQKHINEDIISHRVISKDEFLRVFNEDNSYLNSWPEEQKLKMITKIDSQGNLID